MCQVIVAPARSFSMYFCVSVRRFSSAMTDRSVNTFNLVLSPWPGKTQCGGQRVEIGQPALDLREAVLPVDEEGAHAERAGTVDVILGRVADHRRVLGRDPQPLEHGAEDRRIGLEAGLRAARQAEKIRVVRLGWSPGVFSLLGWQKPKGMHWRTFDWLKMRVNVLTLKALTGLAQRLGIDLSSTREGPG